MKLLIMTLATSLFVFSNVFAATPTKATTLNVIVTDKGFEPASLKVSPNQEVILSVTRKTDATCAKDIIFHEQKIKKDLPLNKAVAINLGKLAKGVVNFSCGMDMISGVINVQ
jgi:plastocyanin domain-containing protein